MFESTNVKQWIAKFDAGEFEGEGNDQAGWYDWFCKDRALPAKTAKLGPKVKRLAKSSKVDQERMYVFFKNNCPLYGRLYDDFRFCDRETGDVVYTVIPSCGHDSNKGRAEVWGKENGFDGPIVAGTWKEVCQFFGV